MGLHPNVRADFRVFWLNFISLSPTLSAPLTQDFTAGVKRRSSSGGQRERCPVSISYYADHLRTCSCGGTDRALAATGFDALVVHAGRPPTAVSRRSRLPLQGQSAFQGVGADRRQSTLHPGVPAGGAATGAVSIRPTTTGIKPARLPQRALDSRRQFDRHRRRLEGRATHWDGLGRVAFIGPEAAGRTACDPECLNPNRH